MSPWLQCFHKYLWSQYFITAAIDTKYVCMEQPQRGQTIMDITENQQMFVRYKLLPLSHA